jgi:hypothetical protein
MNSQYVLKEKLTTPLLNENLNFDFHIKENNEFYIEFINFIPKQSNNIKTPELNQEIINSFKEYKLIKMRELMKLSKFISSKSLSESEFLSIEIGIVFL